MFKLCAGVYLVNALTEHIFEDIKLPRSDHFIASGTISQLQAHRTIGDRLKESILQANVLLKKKKKLGNEFCRGRGLMFPLTVCMQTGNVEMFCFLVCFCGHTWSGERP